MQGRRDDHAAGVGSSFLSLRFLPGWPLSSLTSLFGPSPCPGHYPRHLTTMSSA